MKNLIKTALITFVVSEIILYIFTLIVEICKGASGRPEPVGMFVIMGLFSIPWVLPYSLLASLVLFGTRKLAFLFYSAVLFLPVLVFFILHCERAKFMREYFDLVYLVTGSIVACVHIKTSAGYKREG